MPVLRKAVPEHGITIKLSTTNNKSTEGNYLSSDMAVNYPDSRKLHGDDLQNYIARAAGEVNDENKKRNTVDRSVEELYITIFEMQRWIEKIDDEGNEWKTRFENQEEFNNNMGLQILLMTDMIEELKAKLDSGEEIMPEYDDYSEAKWKKVSNKLERDFQVLEDEVKDIDWRLDQESKAFFITNEGRKTCNIDLNSLNHEIEGDKKQENPPKTPATAFGSSRTPHPHMVPDNPGRNEWSDTRSKSRGRYYNDPYLNSGLAVNQVTPRSKRQDPVAMVLSNMPAYLQPSQWGQGSDNNRQPGQQPRMGDPRLQQRGQTRSDPQQYYQRGVKHSRYGQNKSKPTREDLVQRINAPQSNRFDESRILPPPKGILKQRREKENKRPADPFKDHVTGRQISGPPPKSLYNLPPNRNGPPMRNLPPDQRVIDTRMGPIKKTAAVKKLPQIEPRQSNRRR